MGFRKLFLQCECGRSPARIREVGLTAEHHLVIRWWCVGCKRHILLIKSLADCWRECPTPEGGQEVPDAMADDTSDAQFLRSLGIRFLEGVDS
jgi:hypothetical protein